MHPDDTDVEGTDLGKTEREEHDDTDVNESNWGENNQDQDQDGDGDGDGYSTLVSWNELHNPQRVRAVKAYYLRNTRRNRPY